MSATTNYHNALQIGYQLDKYRIQAILGEGSFGITYLGLDTRHNRQVAIKEYFPNKLAIRLSDQSLNPGKELENFQFGLKQFIQEGKILAQLQHPHIVHVWQIFQSHNTAYLVMAYQQGQSLAKVLKNRGTATPAEIRKIFPPLLSALTAAHQVGLLHLNITPSNIYLSNNNKDNSPIILDFGAARYALGSRYHNLSMMVTPGYAPLELYNNCDNQGAWSDIYALGAVLYHAISGKTPIDALTRFETIKQGKMDPLSPAATLTGNKRYSKHLLEAIDWALKIDEKERPQTVVQWNTFTLSNSSKKRARQFLLKKICRSAKRISVAVLAVVIIAAGIGLGHIFSVKKYLAESHKRLEHIENERKLARELFLALLKQPADSVPFKRSVPLPSQEIRSLLGHESGICVDGCLAFSPDGRHLASGSWDHTIKLWEVNTGNTLQTLQGHKNLVLSIAFSPNGLLLASGSADNTIKLWEVSTGKMLQTLKEEGNWVGSLAFSPDGQILAAEGANYTIKVWELSTGKVLHRLSGHKNIVNSISFNPYDNIIATGSADSTIKLWEVTTGKLLHTFKGHQKDVLSVAFSPNGRTLASGDAASTIKLWDISNGKELQNFNDHKNWVLSVVFSPDGRRLASGSHDHTIKLWDISEGKILQTLPGHDNDVNAIAFSPNGRILASGSRDKTIKLWQ